MVLWKCISDMQRVKRGLVPARSTMVKDEEGNVCSSSEEQQEQWRRHFIKNVQSEFSIDELNE